MRVAAIVRELEVDGWRFQAVHGSEWKFKHPTKPGRVSVPGHPEKEVAAGMLASIRKQAGLSSEGR